MSKSAIPRSRDEHADARPPWAALWVLAAGLAMVVLDGTIVAVAVPTIVAKLHLNITEAQWINSIYAVVFAALLLSVGRIGDWIGRKRIFIAGTSIFVIGSTLAALSDSASTLIWARVIQGIGGAMVLPATLSTVNATFRGSARAAAFGIWGAVMSGAAALGPVLGGWLSGAYGWQLVFWVNVPIGVAVIVATVVFVPETRGERSARGLDVGGLLLSIVGLGALVFAIIEGPRLGWITPSRGVSLLGWRWSTNATLSVVPIAIIISIAALIAFFAWERRRARKQNSQLLDLTLFQLPRFAWGNVTAWCVAVSEFALLFALPLYLMSARGLAPFQTGFLLAAMAMGAFIAGAQARHLSGRFGSAQVVVLGLGLEAAGIFVMAFLLDPSITVWLMVLPLVVYGLGLGLASAQLTSLVLADVPVAQSGEGSATQSTVRQVGSAMGSAMSGALLSVGLSVYLASGTPYDQSVRLSVGSALRLLRARDADSSLVAQLSRQFADGTRLVLFGSVVFLLLGLAGAVQVLRASTDRGVPAQTVAPEAIRSANA